MKEEDKTGEQRLEERGLAPTEKPESLRPGSRDPKEGRELLKQAHELLSRWAEMRPKNRGTLLVTADMDLAPDGEGGLDPEKTGINAWCASIIGVGGVTNIAAIVAIEREESLAPAKEFFNRDER